MRELPGPVETYSTLFLVRGGVPYIIISLYMHEGLTWTLRTLSVLGLPTMISLYGFLRQIGLSGSRQSLGFRIWQFEVLG